ncbi:hypothetical protein C0J52_24928 [Blattella germanica]|nr:hypothetical protein C0J52_24928 [Blattella germanica]
MPGVNMSLGNMFYSCCGEEFELHEKIVNSNGELWHPQCFVCAQCFQAFLEELNSEDREVRSRPGFAANEMNCTVFDVMTRWEYRFVEHADVPLRNMLSLHLANIGILSILFVPNVRNHFWDIVTMRRQVLLIVKHISSDVWKFVLCM